MSAVFSGYVSSTILKGKEGRERKEGRKEGVIDDRTTDVPSSQYILTCEQ